MLLIFKVSGQRLGARVNLGGDNVNAEWSVASL